MLFLTPCMCQQMKYVSICLLNQSKSNQAYFLCNYDLFVWHGSSRGRAGIWPSPLWSKYENKPPLRKDLISLSLLVFHSFCGPDSCGRECQI